jgi:hypothetical protein
MISFTEKVLWIDSRQSNAALNKKPCIIKTSLGKLHQNHAAEHDVAICDVATLKFCPNADRSVSSSP